jgi:hypothetical protein
MRRNLILLLLALIGAVVASECNRYSHCREWRLELALREQGITPERSWGAAALDFVAGDLIAVGEKWQCGIAIERREAVWAVVEAATILPALGSATAWAFRTVGRGLEGIAAIVREAIGVRVFVRGPAALIGRITTERIPFLVVGGALLAVYFGSGELLLDALALLPWPLQLALWAILIFALAKFVWFTMRCLSALHVGLRPLWPRSMRPRLAADEPH